MGAQLVGGVVEGGKGIDLAGLGAGAAHAREVVGQEGIDFFLLAGLRVLRGGEGFPVRGRICVAGEVTRVIALLNGRLWVGETRCGNAERAVLAGGSHDHAAHRLGNGG